MSDIHTILSRCEKNRRSFTWSSDHFLFNSADCAHSATWSDGSSSSNRSSSQQVLSTKFLNNAEGKYQSTAWSPNPAEIKRYIYRKLRVSSNQNANRRTVANIYIFCEFHIQSNSLKLTIDNSFNFDSNYIANFATLIRLSYLFYFFYNFPINYANSIALFK